MCIDKNEENWNVKWLKEDGFGRASETEHYRWRFECIELEPNSSKMVLLNRVCDRSNRSYPIQFNSMELWIKLRMCDNHESIPLMLLEFSMHRLLVHIWEIWRQCLEQCARMLSAYIDEDISKEIGIPQRRHPTGNLEQPYIRDTSKCK